MDPALAFALRTLETAVDAIQHAHQQTADVWEALETVRATGRPAIDVDGFWRAAGRQYRPAHAGYQMLNSHMNGLCRALRVERDFRLLEEAR